MRVSLKHHSGWGLNQFGSQMACERFLKSSPLKSPNRTTKKTVNAIKQAETIGRSRRSLANSPEVAKVRQLNRQTGPD
jgi:hypothetical protein